MMNTKNNTITVHRSGDFHWVGNGFPVRSVFGYNDMGQQLSPFLLLDYAAPYEFAPGQGKRGVEAHPHRGFETVTLAYQGEIEHRDSSGGGGLIGPGDVQWMTAAGGLLHEEMHSKKFTEQGGTFEMVQLWVNLPAKYKSENPRYQTILNASIPRVALANKTVSARIIAGAFGEVTGPAQTFTPINLWDVEFSADTSVSLPLPSTHNKALLVLRGGMHIGDTYATAGDLVVIHNDDAVAQITASSGTKILVMTGEPLNEPIVGYGPFVMNTQAEIKQAFADYQMGKLGVLD